MSVCLCSFRALSRSRTATSKTLTPFLYQTTTIQQHSRIQRRNRSDHIRQRFDDGHDVPFEGEELPPTVDDANASRKTTVTGSEREAFQKLYKKFNQAEKGSGVGEHELDQIADEYYEDDDDGKDTPPQSIDDLFDAVLSSTSGKPKTAPRKSKTKTDLPTLAREILRPEQQQREQERRARQARIKQLRDAEKTRIKALLEAAPTDQALWAVLEREVFAVIRSLDLDSAPASPSGSVTLTRTPSRKATLKSAIATAPQSEPSPTDPAIVFPNYAAHLATAVATLRTKFPSSPLPFAILPAIKDLGRSSYALGATTALYKLLLRAAFYQHHSYTQILSLLQDMDNGGIEYDDGVLALLDDMLAKHEAARKGRYGRAMGAVLRLQLYEENVERVREWQGAIRRRLGVWSEERKRERRLVRRTNSVPEKETRGAVDRIRIREGFESKGGDVPLVGRMEEGVEEGGEGSPDVNGFLKDAVEAPVEAPLEAPIEATVPPPETQAQTDNTPDAEEKTEKRFV